MEMNSSKVSKCSIKTLDGDQYIDDASINPDSETYVVDTITTDNNQSQPLATIDEAASAVSSVTDHYSNVNNVKASNERNQRQNNSSCISSN